ncbi:MAG: tRNA glutamyl-Q(34) synthetase GluQRS, partial [Paracoccaceae bacterium]
MSDSPTLRERFAPSPTGYLHLGHAFSALTVQNNARRSGAEFLLRVEDIDIARCRPEFETAILEDLQWLGIRWTRPIMRQSTRFHAYRQALDTLVARGLCYPCHCTRRDIANALSAPQEGVTTGSAADDGPLYPGTCRLRTDWEGAAVRLNMTRALKTLGRQTDRLGYYETGTPGRGWQQLNPDFLAGKIGDVILARRDIGTSYHLAVVSDDADQAITHVTRGTDLAASTALHVVLQALLGLPTPAYHHHRLI